MSTVQKIETFTEEDLASFNPPAPFCNKFSVTATNNGLLRIAFGEGLVPNTPTHFRGAFICPLEDAKQLVDVLSAAVTELKALAAQKPKAE